MVHTINSTSYGLQSSYHYGTPSLSRSSQIAIHKKASVTPSSSYSLLPVSMISFKNNVPTNTLTVDISNIDTSVIGEAGIELKTAFQEYHDKIKSSVDRLYNDRNVKGAGLKWIDLPDEELKKLPEITHYVEKHVRHKFDDAIIVGIGGSSLGAKTLLMALTPEYRNNLSKKERAGLPKIHFLENIDPDRLKELEKKINLKKTLLVIVCKSGRTPETLANYLYFEELLQKKVGKEKIKDRIVVVADKDPEKSDLTKRAIQNGYKTFVVPDDVGGRYSVFSDVGILPAAIAGVDVKKLLLGASHMTKFVQDCKHFDQNPATSQALVHKLFYDQGKHSSVMLPYSDKIALFPDWYAQLWGESLSSKIDKDNNIINLNHTPIKSVGVIDQHSQLQLWREGQNDKLFTFINVQNFKNRVPIMAPSNPIPSSWNYFKRNTFNDLIKIEEDATKNVLVTDNKRPVINVSVPFINEYTIGQLMQLYMLQTALTGELHNLGIHTFLQPGVEKSKDLTIQNMGRLSREKE